MIKAEAVEAGAAAEQEAAGNAVLTAERAVLVSSAAPAALETGRGEGSSLGSAGGDGRCRPCPCPCSLACACACSCRLLRRRCCCQPTRASVMPTDSGEVIETAELMPRLRSIRKKQRAQKLGAGSAEKATGKTSNASAVPPVTAHAGHPVTIGRGRGRAEGAESGGGAISRE